MHNIVVSYTNFSYNWTKKNESESFVACEKDEKNK